MATRFVPLPTATVRLGSILGEDDPEFHPEEKPREVKLESFEMGDLVTVEEYSRFMNSAYASRWRSSQLLCSGQLHGHALPSITWSNGMWFVTEGRERQPVEQATWFGAHQYGSWITANDPGVWVYRLPSEWEWEYAVRGNDGRMWPWGNEPPSAERGWIWSSITWQALASRVLPEVGSHPNGNSPEGVRDLMGYGFLEYCSDVYLAHPGNVVASGTRREVSNLELPRSARGDHRRARTGLTFIQAFMSDTVHQGMSWSRFSCSPIDECNRQATLFRLVRQRVSDQ